MAKRTNDSSGRSLLRLGREQTQIVALLVKNSPAKLERYFDHSRLACLLFSNFSPDVLFWEISTLT